MARTKQSPRKGQAASTLRATAFAVGYLTLFQSDGATAATKVAFVVVSGLFALVSLASMMRRAELDPPRARGRGLTLGIVLTVVLVILQVPGLAWTQVTVDSWMRDALNYLLLPIAILIGSEFGLRASRRAVAVLVVTSGVFGAFSFMAAWLQKRGGSSLGFEQVGLASSMVPIAGFAFCLAWYFASVKFRPLLLLLALVQMGLLATSGGRTVWIYCFVAILTAAVAGSAPALTKLARSAITAIATGGAVALVFVFSNAFGGGLATSRFDWFSRFFDSGVEAVRVDGSGIERARAYQWTLDLWGVNPLFGRGFGHTFPSVTTGLTNANSFTLDSPFVVLAKFGSLGVFVLLVALTAIFIAWHRVTQRGSVARLFLTVVVVVNLVLLANGFPTENRGFPLLMFICAAVAIAFSDSEKVHIEPLVSTTNLNGGPRTKLTTRTENRWR